MIRVEEVIVVVEGMTNQSLMIDGMFESVKQARMVCERIARRTFGDGCFIASFVFSRNN